MKKNLTAFMAMIFVLSPSAFVFADDATKNAVEHPVSAYHEHEVKADAMDAQELTQKQAEVKAQMDQAKTDYEKSLAANGADNEVTKQAKKRFMDARKEYRKYSKKVSKTTKELSEDEQKVNKDRTTP